MILLYLKAIVSIAFFILQTTIIQTFTLNYKIFFNFSVTFSITST